MNQEEAKTNWLTHDNFVFLLHIYNIPIGSFEQFRFYLNKILSIFDCFDNDSNMSMNDSFISFRCENSDYMEDGNEKYCTFQSIGRKIYFIEHIGTKICTKCGYIDDYPEDVIPNFLNILKLSFPDLKFIENHGFIQIWNLNTNSMDFIQIRKIAEITSYNFYILLKDTIKSLVINHKYLYSFFSFLFTSKNVICFLLQKM
jgi:hypothetical protein